MKPSTYIPLLLLVYLAVMAYLGRFELQAGNTVYYFTLVGLTLICIGALYLFLRHWERHRKPKK